MGANAPRLKTKAKRQQRHHRKSSLANNDIENVIDSITKESPKKSSTPKKKDGRVSKASGIVGTGRHSFDMNEMFEFGEDTRNIENVK